RAAASRSPHRKCNIGPAAVDPTVRLEVILFLQSAPALPKGWWGCANGGLHMDYELVIRGGTVIDGTGSPRFTGDIAVRDGRVVEVGKVAGRGVREIDASGLIVAPGIVDLHTHYDAQLHWDPYCTASG